MYSINDDQTTNRIITVSTEIERDIESSFDDDSGLENNHDELRACLRLRQAPASSSNFTPSLIIHAQDGDSEADVRSISLNSNWGIVSIGTNTGLLVIDYLQNKKIFAMSTNDIMR